MTASRAVSPGISRKTRRSPSLTQNGPAPPLILSGPRVNRVLDATVDNPESYGLEPPQTTVEVTERGGQKFEFHLGHLTPDQKNQYAQLVGSPTLFTVTALWGDVINGLVSDPPYPGCMTWRTSR